MNIRMPYFAFPEKEDRGVGTGICRALAETARANDPRVEVTARTLPEKNASTRILEKNGFRFSSAVRDPDDGEVREWSLGTGK